MVANKKIRKVLLTQPNYWMFNKKSWNLFPYSLGILNACIKKYFKTELFDPNFNNLKEKEIIDFLKKSNPDIIGVSTNSTEYIKHITDTTQLLRKILPNAIIIQGGILPTISIDLAMNDKNIDYWIIGEGEFSFLELLQELQKSSPDFSKIKGLAYYDKGIKKINPPREFIEDLDCVPFADYENLDFMAYANTDIKYGQGLHPDRRPYALTITSRGCPYQCIFCSGEKVSGKKVRMRSAKNVLAEIDELHKRGIKEIIFLDDNFLFNRQRAIAIMNGLIERKYDLVWKCANLPVFLLDEELLDLMKKSKCYQMTISIESGNQELLDNVIKKPINLDKLMNILELIKQRNFEIIANFIIGFPQETWSQIRNTFAFAEKINVDLVNFHIATPLPNTELAEICIKEGYLPKNFNDAPGSIGYTKGIINTQEFSPQELQILRAFEWDRINFKTEKKNERIAKIQGISVEELDQWRKETRKKIGVNIVIG